MTCYSFSRKPNPWCIPNYLPNHLRPGDDATNRRIGGTATDNSWWAYPTATAATVSYTANNLDQYTAVGAVTPTYDGNGNLTFDGTFTYGYDAESRLTSVTQGGTTVATYAYDALGHRKSKTVGTTTAIYVRDPGNRALLDYNGATGAVLDWYAFGAGPNDALTQLNVAANTRATYIPDLHRLGDRRAQFRHRRHHQDRLPAPRRKPLRRPHLPLPRRALPQIGGPTGRQPACTVADHAMAQGAGRGTGG